MFLNKLYMLISIIIHYCGKFERDRDIVIKEKKNTMHTLIWLTTDHIFRNVRVDIINFEVYVILLLK